MLPWAFKIVLMAFAASFVLAEIKTLSFKCSASNITVKPDIKCFAKAYSRKVTTISVSLNFTRPIYDAKAVLEVRYRNFGPSLNTLLNTTVDFCGFVNGSDNNVIMKWVFDTISDSVSKDVIHACPYYGAVAANNMTVDTSFQAPQYLKGHYFTKFRIYDDSDFNVFTALYHAEIM